MSELTIAGVTATFIEDDKLAQWLKRCCWGVLDAKDCYPNSAVEMSELGVVAGG